MFGWLNNAARELFDRHGERAVEIAKQHAEMLMRPGDQPAHDIALRVAALLGAAFVALHAVPSSAQTVCGEHAKFVDMLDVTYAEKAVAMGLTSTGAVIEVLTSPTGT